jgi:hypothetical protein
VLVLPLLNGLFIKKETGEFMRDRILRFSYFSNEVLATLDDKAQKLFLGLTCMADREGKLEDRPCRIRGLLFPYSPDLDIEKLLNILTNAKFIMRYMVNGENYILIPKFLKHQSIHQHEKASVIPYPEGFIPPIVLKPVREKTLTSYERKQLKEKEILDRLTGQVAHEMTIEKGKMRKQ